MRTPALIALLIAAPAFGQRFTHPPGLSPTITPAMLPGAFPGTRFPAPFAPAGAVAPPFIAYRPFGYAPAFANPPLYGYYGNISNFIGPRLGYGYGYGNYPAPIVPTPPPLVGTSPVVNDGPSPDSALTAQLAIEFPAAVDLKIDGKTDAGKGVATDTGVTRTVTTRALKPGETATFKVSAEWEQDGKRVEWDRAVTLGRGETSRLKVARGFPKE